MFWSTDKSCKPTTMEKMDRCSWVGVGTCHDVLGGILYNEWYLLDTHNTNKKNPKRLLLRHGLNQNFPKFPVLVYGTVFSGTICVDPCKDESWDLAEIARVKIMEAQGVSDLPPAIQHLSVHYACAQGSKICLHGSRYWNLLPCKQDGPAYNVFWRRLQLIYFF